MNHTEIEKLEKEIIEASQAYYDGKPILPDDIFDVKIEALRFLNPESEVLTVGFGYQPVGQTAEHLIYPIGSLDKIKQEDLKVITDIPFDKQEKDIFVMPKLDGGSVVLYYLKGKFWKAITRGSMLSDGTYQGIVVTDNVRHSVPETIPLNIDAAIRAEMIITWEDFFEMEGTHPRNLAVGLSRSIHKKKKLVRNLRVIALYICGYRNDPRHRLSKSRPEEYAKLKSWGFETPLMLRITKREFVEGVIKYNPKRAKDLKKVSDEFFHMEKSSCLHFTYPTDGLVLIDPNARSENELVKGWNKIDWSSIAFKFNEESATAMVEDITWEVSRTGRLIPVLNIEETYLSGAYIRNVTANNYTWLKNTKCGIDSKIEIVRSNEIIPMVKSVIRPSLKINAPKRCPACDYLLINDSVDLKCSNDECGLKTQASLYRIFTHFFPKGIGTITILKIIDTYNINSISDIQNLYSPIEEQLSKQFGEKTSALIIEGLKSMWNYTPSIQDILYFANIPQVGIVASRNLSEIAPSEFKEYVRIKEFPNMYRRMCPTNLSWEAINNDKYLERVQELLNLFNNKLKEPERNHANLGWKVCVTGDVSLPRKSWFKALRKFGISEASGVSKKTSMLVTNKTEKTGKFKKANDLNVPILNEDEFYESIAKHLNISVSDVFDAITTE